MKVNTNLTPRELNYIGTKLQELAKGQRSKVLMAENKAEKKLFSEVEDSFEELLDDMFHDIEQLFVGDIDE